MVVAEQVQYAMDRQVGVVMAQRFALFGRLARNDRRAQDEISE